MRSHAEAHAEDEQAHGAIASHPMVFAGDAAVIAQPGELDALIERLRAAGSFGYDTEFIGEQSYFPKLCVIQVATSTEIALIDPLGGVNGGGLNEAGLSGGRLDVQRLWELIADESVEKIVHAGRPDLEPVVRYLGRAPANVFDTQIAAAFAGLRYPLSLTDAVQELAGAELPQGLKFSQWDHRPLSARQMRYAANDVRYLPRLRQALGERLESTGNAGWAREECRTLCDASLYAVDAQSQSARVRGADTLGPRELAVLSALLKWRDQAARGQDVPPRALVKDGVLLGMAVEPPRSLADLDRVRHLPRPVEQAHGRDIVEVTQRALDEMEKMPGQSTEIERGGWDSAGKGPGRRRERYDERARVEALWDEVCRVCAARAIDPMIATSKKELLRWVRETADGQPIDDEAADDAAPDKNAVDSSSRLMRGWRRELLEPILVRPGPGA